LERWDEAIDTYDEVVARFGDADEPTLQGVVRAARAARAEMQG
jgi:hypothetical protein